MFRSRAVEVPNGVMKWVAKSLLIFIAGTLTAQRPSNKTLNVHSCMLFQ